MKVLLLLVIFLTSLTYVVISNANNGYRFMGCNWNIPTAFEKLNDNTYFSLSKHSKIYFKRDASPNQLKSGYAQVKVLEDIANQGFRYQRLVGKGEFSNIYLFSLLKSNYKNEMLRISIRGSDIIVNELNDKRIKLTVPNKSYVITANCISS